MYPKEHPQSDAPIGPYKAVVGIGVDEGEETGIICDFEQHRRIFTRVDRGPAPAARPVITLMSGIGGPTDKDFACWGGANMGHLCGPKQP